MYLFKKEKKKSFLKGRTIRYLTRTGIIECSEVHLSNILNGKITCSSLLAKNIAGCVGEKIEDLFIKLEK